MRITDLIDKLEKIRADLGNLFVENESGTLVEVEAKPGADWLTQEPPDDFVVEIS